MNKRAIIKITGLLAIALVQSSCATHSSNSESPLFRKFSVNPILKKHDDTLHSSSSQLSNYELDGVVGTATVNLSD